MEFIYKGLEAEFDRHIVTDEEVDTQLERLHQQTPKVKVVYDRPAQNGDELVIDYEGWRGEEQFPGGTAQYQTLVLGSGRFIPGFEDQLIGAKPGDKVDVNVTFPEEYHAPELAGKEAEFHCTIHAIRIKTVYDLDDVFAQEVGGCYTFEEFKEQLTQSMQQYADQQGQMDLQDSLLRQAAATLELEVTAEQIKEAVDAQIQGMKAQLAQQGLTLDMYCQFMSTTEEQLRADAEPEAEAAVRMRAAIEKIVKLENLVAEEKEMEDAYQVVCRRNNITMDELQENMDDSLHAAIENSVLAGKVMRLVLDAADLSEQ